MHVKGVIEEDFVNYKVPSMFINTCFCDFKCCTELGLDIGVCQNSPLAQSDTKEIIRSVLPDCRDIFKLLYENCAGNTRVLVKLLVRAIKLAQINNTKIDKEIIQASVNQIII